MANYAIGDIHGCYQEFLLLLDKIDFNGSTDNLFLVGDIINRGPQSLEVLEWVYQHSHSVVNVLGNHDIFLLGRYAKTLQKGHSETIGDILSSSRSSILIDYLRSCPLIHHINDHNIILHAGMHPKVDCSTLFDLAHEISDALSKDNYHKFIKMLFEGKHATYYHDKLPHETKLQFAANVLTRMRYLRLDDDLSLDFECTMHVNDAPKHVIPWFKVNSNNCKRVICGHWSSLGLRLDRHVCALDTGCVWGRELSAINIDTGDIISVKSYQ